MKRWVLAGALAFAAAGHTLASDLPPPGAPPAPPRAPATYVPVVAPVYNWGGIYFAFNLGYGFGTSNWTDPNDPGGATGNFNLKGFLVGPTLGFNFQTDAFVIGAEDVAPELRPVARVLAPLLRGIAPLMRWQKPNVLTMFVETEGSWRVPYALARRES